MTRGRPPLDDPAWIPWKDAARATHARLRAPLQGGGVGEIVARIPRRGRDVTILLTAAPDLPLRVQARISTVAADRLQLIDLDASRLEVLRDAIDAAIRLRDRVVAELDALVPPRTIPVDDEDNTASAPRPLRPERTTTAPSTDAASRASVEGPLFLGDDADEDDAP